jgi:hypothetical protein
MIPVETIPGMEDGKIKENEWLGGNTNMIYLIYYMNICKHYKVPPPSTTIKKKYFKKTHEILGVVAQPCPPSYMGSINRRTKTQASQNLNMRPHPQIKKV